MRGARPGSQRSSRQASPVIGPPNAFAQTQSFAPPQSQGGGFSFSFGADTAPSFSPQPSPNNPFFAQNPADMTSQQNGGGALGAGQNSNSSSFSLQSNPQTQQNGFNPSTTSIFGSQPQNQNTTPSFAFGQAQNRTQQPQPNGSGSGTVNGFGTTFGNHQPAQQQKETSPFAFGASQSAQTNATTAFGSAQEQASKPSTPFQFSPSPSAEQPAKANTPMFGGFGQQPQQGGEIKSGLFGATLSAEQPSQKSGDSVFSSLGNKSNGIRPGMFTQQNSEQAPKATPSFSFGQQVQTNGEQTSKPKPTFTFGKSAVAPSEQTPKATPSFSFGQQNGDKLAAPVPQSPKASHSFGSFGQQNQPRPNSPLKFSQSQEEVETPKPSNPFGGIREPQQTAAPSFSFAGTQQVDTSMISPESTPQKESDSQATKPPVVHTPASAGRTLFDRMGERNGPATAPKPFSAPMSTSTSGAPNAGARPDILNLTEAPATTGRPAKSVLSTPAASAFQKPPLFAPSAAPSAGATDGAKAQSAKSRNASASSTTPKSLKSLNAALVAHLRTENHSVDWSPILSYYMGEAAKLTGDDAFVGSDKRSDQRLARTPAPQQPHSMSAQVSAPTGEKQSAFNAATGPRPSAPENVITMHKETPAGNMLNYAAQPSATASTPRKRSADDELPKDASTSGRPGTEKRAKQDQSIEYPKLPEGASNTARLFASTLEKSAETPADKSAPPWNFTSNFGGNKGSEPSSTPRFGPPADVVAKVRDDAAKKVEVEKPKTKASGFTPATTSVFAGKGAETPKMPTFGFTAATASGTAASKGTDMPKPPIFTFSGAAEAVTQTRSQDSPDKPKAPTFGFTPSTTESTVKAPATVGFKPLFSAPAASNFMAAFGQQASTEAEEARKRRKDEEYDSEEDDEAAWEAKDRAAQEAKRREIQQAAKKAKAFIPTTTSTPTPATSASDSPGLATFGFRPTSTAPTAGSTNFMAAFTQQASSQAEEARKRRKEEENDSEEDDEADWEAKDKAAQEAKRRAIEEAARNAKGFVFNAPASSKKPVDSTQLGAGKSLFQTNGFASQSA